MVEVMLTAQSRVNTDAGRNQPINSDDWTGVVNGKKFDVQITPTAAPHWYGGSESLDNDDREEVLAAIEAKLEAEMFRRRAKAN